MTDQNRLPSAVEALTQAYERLQLGNAADAEVWIALAREIREGSTRPLLDRALDRLTLHDVEGIVCAHGRVAIRRKGDHAGRWYLHTDDGSNCERHDAPREHLRRISEAAIIAAEDGRTSGVLSTAKHRPTSLAEPKAAARHYANDVMHVVPHEPAKVVPVAEGFGNPLRPDTIFGYARGQVVPPTEAQARYALVWRKSLDAGSPLPPPFGEADVPAVRSLVDEILDRGHHYLLGEAVEQAIDTTQTMPRDFRGEQGLGDVLSKTVQLDASQIAPGREASGGLCEHCHFEIFALPAEEVGVPDAYRHTLTGQAVCHVRAGGAVTFATPATPQVASGR